MDLRAKGADLQSDLQSEGERAQFVALGLAKSASIEINRDPTKSNE